MRDVRRFWERVWSGPRSGPQPTPSRENFGPGNRRWFLLPRLLYAAVPLGEFRFAVATPQPHPRWLMAPALIYSHHFSRIDGTRWYPLLPRTRAPPSESNRWAVGTSTTLTTSLYRYTNTVKERFALCEKKKGKKLSSSPYTRSTKSKSSSMRS